jgi:hypothetical protein
MFVYYYDKNAALIIPQDPFSPKNMFQQETLCLKEPKEKKERKQQRV